MTFTPLHVNSGYSFLKSGLTIAKIQNAVKSNRYYGCGLCDFEVMHGLPEFIKSMQQINAPFIVGVELIIKGLHVCVYVKDESGYRTLCRLSPNFQEEQIIIDTLQREHKGLVGILSTSEKEAHDNLIFDSRDTIETIKLISNLFENFYIGVDISSSEDRLFAANVRDFAEKYTYVTIAFPKINYLKKEDAITIEMTEAIARNDDQKLTNKEKEGYHYFLSNKNYEDLYKPSEISLTNQLVDDVHFDFSMHRGDMLSFPVDDTISYLKGTCLQQLILKGINDEAHQKRLEKELDIIISMGYADYFLIVSDYVKYANSVGILTGPGRGSAGASLVAYLLDITRIDPLKYNLLFERFLNPARKKMPDIDMDFMDTRRDEVVSYLREKYGQDRVANIVTYSTIAARQSIRDIGRIYNYPERDISLLSSRLVMRDATLRESYKKLASFRQLVDSDKFYLEIVSLASKIESLPRQTGLHAAGVVLNNVPIENSMPISKDFQGNYITQYSMDYLEEQGFLKMDILGLRNLTIISNCVNLINKHYKDAHLDAFNLPFDTKEVYDLISSGMTMGVFQLESSGMKNAIKQLKPSCFDDIVALLALFRPGPMANIPVYARRKLGKEKVTYISDELKPILAPTYGIIVYQEQIMQISQVMANFTLEQADIFRGAVSKKDSEKMAKAKDDFISGAIKNGYSQNKAEQVYNLIAQFANYGFNKAHSVGYSIIACEMAYLKYKYPLEFYTAILSNSSATDTVKFADYVTEMKKRNISLSLPDINKATMEFQVVDDKIMLPLSAIKELPILSARAIIDERNNSGEFKDFTDFVVRMYQYKLSENNIVRLINSGCFDKMNPSRESLRSSVNSLIQYAEVSGNADGQIVFDDMIAPPPLIAEIEDDPLDNLEKEYDSLSIMLSSNPLKYKQDLLLSKGVSNIADSLEHKGNILIAGIIKSVKTIMTKKDVPMAFIKLFDETAEMEITIFSDLYSSKVPILKKNNIVVVKAHFNAHNGVESYIADEMNLLEE